MTFFFAYHCIAQKLASNVCGYIVYDRKKMYKKLQVKKLEILGQQHSKGIDVQMISNGH